MTQIRQATADDVIGIVYVQATTWIATYPDHEHGVEEADIRSIDWHSHIPSWRHMVASSEYEVVVAAGDEGIVYGFACVAVKPQTNYIQHMYVLPEHQQQGIGRRLLRHILDTYTSPMSLHVATYNHTAITFYEAHGFTPTQTRGAYTLPSGKQIPTQELVLHDQGPSTSRRRVNRTELGRIVGLRPSTIKWYSELGLLPYAQAGPGCRRYFDPAEVQTRLQVLREWQDQGWKLEEIAQTWQNESER